ncbi:MAG: hypothetical protein L6R37_003309 [Teloschistes peruensis]|nr:MAG: hypothetical protein L6R37_003309 [Teloschistes peruensis]
MDPNRLRLNFGGAGGGAYNNDRSYPASDGRVFPTTPSTFPQSVFPAQNGQIPNDYANPQVQSPGLYAPPSATGYFMNSSASQYQYGQQQHSQYQNGYQSPTLQPPQSSFQQRPGYGNDPTTGLARQFSNQNLGSNQRQPNPYGRQPSPSNPRPRNQGAQGHNMYGSHLAAPATAGDGRPDSENNDRPPMRDPDKYSTNVQKRAQATHASVEAFFKENITRARERNVRAQELEKSLNEPNLAQEQKVQKIDRMMKQEAQYIRFLRTKESPKNFATVKIIGKGAFGEVKLVQRKTDAKIYALKSLVKTEMFKRDQLAHVRAERDILAESDSPWVVKLHTTFQDPTYLYMLMEFLPGGDLMTMLIKYEIFSEDITRFYMAEIVLAIEAVHKLGYVHRDIKPDNILLDRGGHIKLTDFGLSTGFHPQHENSYYQQLLKGSSSKPKDNRASVNLDQINLTVSNRGQINTWRKSRRVMAYSTVGTPDYIAPEIFTGEGYAFSCDWWSVGAIMFECLIGWPPFCAEDPHDTYRKIVNWRETLYFPEDIVLGETARHLICSLLCSASHRLGTSGGAHGASEIKQHDFFRGVNWDTLRKIRAPFEPRLQSNVDVSYFPTDEIDQTDHSAAYHAQIDALGEEHMAEMSLPFIGYTYKRFDAFRGS